MARREQFGVSGKIIFDNKLFEIIPRDQTSISLIDKLEPKNYFISVNEIKLKLKQNTYLSQEKNKPLLTKNKITLNRDFWESASGHAETESGSILASEKPGMITLHEYESNSRFIGKSRSDYESLNYEIPVDEFITFIKENGSLG